MRLTSALGTLAAANILVLVVTQWYVVSSLGATRETDALFAGMAVPQMILMIVSGALGSVLVPLFATVDRATAQREAWTLLVTVTGGFAAVATILVLTAPFWVRLLVPGFSSSAQALTVSLTQIQLVGVVLTAGAGVATGYVQARGHFVWAESAPLIGGLIGLGALFYLLGPYGVVAAAWAIVLRALVHFACLMPLLGRWRRPDWQSPVQAEAARRTGPLLLGGMYYKADPLVDRFLASMSVAGGLSLLAIGQQVYSAGSQLITRAIVIPIVPRLAQYASQEQWSAFRACYRRRLLLASGPVSVAVLLLVLLGGHTANLISRFGGLQLGEAALFSSILWTLIGMLIGGSLGQITSTAFYSMGDTRTPTKLGVCLFTLYVPAKCLLFFYYGLIGITGSISGYYLTAVLLQFVVLERVVRRRASEAGRRRTSEEAVVQRSDEASRLDVLR